MPVKSIIKKLFNRGASASNNRGKLGEISDLLEESLQALPVLLEYKAADAVKVICNTSGISGRARQIAVNLTLGECEVLRRGVESGIVEDPYLKAMVLHLCDLSDGYRDPELPKAFRDAAINGAR